MYNEHLKEKHAPVEEREGYSLNHEAFSAIDICKYVEERRLMEDMHNEEDKSPTQLLKQSSGV